MLRKFLICFIFSLSVLNAKATVENYLFVTYHGNDSELLLSTVRIDNSLRPIVRNNILYLFGENFVAECNLDEHCNAWAYTDSDLKILAISELLPYGHEINWFTLSQKDGELMIETENHEIYLGKYTDPINQEYGEQSILETYKRYVYDFSGSYGKIDAGLLTITLRRR